MPLITRSSYIYIEPFKYGGFVSFFKHFKSFLGGTNSMLPILFFYPKDNTPGCTAESCNLSESYDELTAKGFEVIGVSPDSIQSHQKFIAKHNLRFNLIADTEKEILQQYDAWGLKKMYGKEYMGVLRKTFVIDENGLIVKIFEKVKTKDHTNQILTEMGL